MHTTRCKAHPVHTTHCALSACTAHCTPFCTPPLCTHYCAPSTPHLKTAHRADSAYHPLLYFFLLFAKLPIHSPWDTFCKSLLDCQALCMWFEHLFFTFPKCALCSLCAAYCTMCIFSCCGLYTAHRIWQTPQSCILHSAHCALCILHGTVRFAVHTSFTFIFTLHAIWNCFHDPGALLQKAIYRLTSFGTQDRPVFIHFGSVQGDKWASTGWSRTKNTFLPSQVVVESLFLCGNPTQVYHTCARHATDCG